MYFFIYFKINIKSLIIFEKLGKLNKYVKG